MYGMPVRQGVAGCNKKVEQKLATVTWVQTRIREGSEAAGASDQATRTQARTHTPQENQTQTHAIALGLEAGPVETGQRPVELDLVLRQLAVFPEPIVRLVWRLHRRNGKTGGG